MAVYKGGPRYKVEGLWKGVAQTESFSDTLGGCPAVPRYFPCLVPNASPVFWIHPGNMVSWPPPPRGLHRSCFLVLGPQRRVLAPDHRQLGTDPACVARSWVTLAWAWPCLSFPVSGVGGTAARVRCQAGLKDGPSRPCPP